MTVFDTAIRKAVYTVSTIGHDPAACNVYERHSAVWTPASVGKDAMAAIGRDDHVADRQELCDGAHSIKSKSPDVAVSYTHGPVEARNPMSPCATADQCEAAHVDADLVGPDLDAVDEGRYREIGREAVATADVDCYRETRCVTGRDVAGKRVGLGESNNAMIVGDGQCRCCCAQQRDGERCEGDAVHWRLPLVDPFAAVGADRCRSVNHQSPGSCMLQAPNDVPDQYRGLAG